MQVMTEEVLELQGKTVRITQGTYRGEMGVIADIEESEGSIFFIVILENGKERYFTKDFIEIIEEDEGIEEEASMEEKQEGEDAIVELEEPNEPVDDKMKLLNLLCKNCRDRLEWHFNYETVKSIINRLNSSDEYYRITVCGNCLRKLIRKGIINIEKEEESVVNAKLDRFIEYTNELIERAKPKQLNFVTNVRELQNFIEIIELCNDEVKIEKEGSKLHVKTVDSSHVFMIEATLKAFNASEEEVTFAMYLGSLEKWLKVLDKDDEIKIRKIEDGKIYIKSNELERIESLLDESEIHESKLPKLDLPAIFTVDLKKLWKAVKSIETISDYFRIKVSKEGAIVEGEGDIRTIRAKFKKEELEELVCDEEKYKAAYPIDVVLPFLKLLKKLKVDKVRISFNTDNPARFEFTVSDHVSGCFLVAPRIEG